MNTFISQNTTNLIRNIGLIALLLVSFQSEALAKKTLLEENGVHKVQIEKGAEINVHVAVTDIEQAQGLSGVKKEDFATNQAVLFYYPDDGQRQFWMPDTHFNLDIFFLDKDLKVLNVERNVPAHPGMTEPPPIARTGLYTCRYVLELRADSDLAKKIKKGTVLKWLGQKSLSEIGSKTRP
ncbi:DUF192 domain-containing protein [Bacteriovorax sp. BSW11_IV]|uniref:DUF192 domain-containing protein n=1 Tax=Bacteriovorax sp. BSW11_IV TaxID=1353529 RepID=UPI0005500ADE|nr:DUF192 domain-containing protein [Bacteriovorax sp. BSW11_IV]